MNLAGKGTRHPPTFHESTPETVWKYFGWSEETAKIAGATPTMFNSFIDGTKSGVEVASIALRGEPTGCPIAWQGDVVTTAKRDLRPGEILDGEGGFMVWGKILPAATSLARRGLPLGLAHMKLVRPVAKGSRGHMDGRRSGCRRTHRRLPAGDGGHLRPGGTEMRRVLGVGVVRRGPIR